MGPTSDALPGFLWIETALAVPSVGLGLVPWLLVSTSALQPPTGYQAVWLLVGLALVLLWFVLLVHLVVDCWRLFRDGTDSLVERGGVHVGFRATESLGVVAVPVVLQTVASRVSDGPSAHGMAAIGGLFVVMGVLAAVAVVVVLHAGWLLAVVRVERATPSS